MFYPGWISKCARCLNAAKPKKTNVLTTYPSVFFPGDNRIFFLRNFCQLCVPSWVRLLRNDSTINLLLHISLLRTKEKTQFNRPNSSAPFDVRKEHNYASIKHVLFIVIFTVCNVIVKWIFFFIFLFTKAVETHATHKGCRRSDLITAVSSLQKWLLTRHLMVSWWIAYEIVRLCMKPETVFKLAHTVSSFYSSLYKYMYVCKLFFYNIL